MFEELLELCNIKSNELEREQKKVRELTELLVGMNKLSGYINSKQSDVALLGRLIDQVDRFSKELADLKSQMAVRQSLSIVKKPSFTLSSISAQRRGTKKSRSLDNRARALIDILKDRPDRYTTRDLMDMLGINKVLVTQVMKRAIEIDPKHVKLDKGEHRRFYISYIQKEETQMADDDRRKLELMSMT
jgi:hypothetical protein